MKFCRNFIKVVFLTSSHDTILIILNFLFVKQDAKNFIMVKAANVTTIIF